MGTMFFALFIVKYIYIYIYLCNIDAVISFLIAHVVTLIVSYETNVEVPPTKYKFIDLLKMYLKKSKLFYNKINNLMTHKSYLNVI